MKILLKYIIYLTPFLLLLVSAETYFVYKSTQDVLEKELEEAAESNFKIQTRTVLANEKFYSLPLEEKKELLDFQSKSLKSKLYDSEDVKKQMILSAEQLAGLKKNKVLELHDLSFSGIDSLHNTFFLIEHPNLPEPLILQYSQDIFRLNQHLKESLVNGFLKILGILALFLIFAYVVGVKYIARPLAEIKDHLQAIAKGNFSKCEVSQSRTEIFYIARMINDLASKLKAYQEQLLKSRDEKISLLEKFRHQDRLKSVGQMAAGVAHELGTPLNVVSGRASLIISGSKENDIIQSAKIIKDESKRMTNIIQGMLSFSRKKKEASSTTDIESVVDEAIELLGYDARKRSVSVTSKINSNSCVRLKKNELQQVILNLVKNAIQACGDSGEVSINLVENNLLEELVIKNSNEENPSHFVGITIEDSGIGMTQKIQDSIFDPFFTTKDVGEGTGLGLSICHGIVTEAGGFIDLESKMKSGTKFFVVLPNCDEESRV